MEKARQMVKDLRFFAGFISGKSDDGMIKKASEVIKEAADLIEELLVEERIVPQDSLKEEESPDWEAVLIKSDLLPLWRQVRIIINALVEHSLLDGEKKDLDLYSEMNKAKKLW